MEYKNELIKLMEKFSKNTSQNINGFSEEQLKEELNLAKENLDIQKVKEITNKLNNINKS